MPSELEREHAHEQAAVEAARRVEWWAEVDAVREALAPMFADGFDHHEHEHLKPGVRVRNRSEQYASARQFGTAEVVAVLRKPGAWEQKYGRLNIEVLVQRDDGSFSWWADYGTFLPEGCWSCGGPGCMRCAGYSRAAEGMPRGTR
jgi:hypothetical protein